jgi:NitT/TauT family transport system substrate-binding protein
MRLTAAGMPRGSRAGNASLRGGRRRGAALAAGLGAVALVAGCSSGSHMAGTGPVNATVTIGTVPGIETVPLFLASHQGLFRSSGLTVSIRDFGSVNTELQALASGKINIASGDYGPFLYASDQGRPKGIRIVADGYDAGPGVLEVLTLPGSGISSPQQLEGKAIASPDTADLATSPGTPDSLATAATTSVLRGYGIDMATVTWKPMAESAEITALRQHQVQAILVTEPYIYQAESQLGAVEVLDACSGPTAGLPLAGYFTTASWAQNDGTALIDFKEALGQAQSDAALSGPVQDALPGFTGMTKLEAAVVTVGTYPDTTDASDVQRVSSLLSDQGILRTPLTVGNIMAGS